MMLKRYFRTAYFLFLFSAVISGCSQEDFPEKNEPEGVPVRFVLDNSIISNLDTDTEFVPMRRSETGYNNFAAFNAEFAIYRKIGGEFILQKYEYKKQSLTPEFIDNSTKISLLEKLGLTSSYVLQPGEYRACVGVNVPNYVVPFPKYGATVSSIIQSPDVFLRTNAIRDVYFSFEDFIVEKKTELEQNNENNIEFKKTLTRKASPIRFILITQGEGFDDDFPKVLCNIVSSDNSMPIGIDISGNAVLSDEKWDLGGLRTVEMPIKLSDSNSNITYYFPSYCRRDGDTSIFVPYRNDEQLVKLELSIEEFYVGTGAMPISPLQISDVLIYPNKITNIVLELNDVGKLIYINDDNVLNGIKAEWEKQTNTPFDYLEYNEPK